MDPFADETQEGSRSLDPGQLMRAFWRRRLLFLIPFLLCLGGVVLAIGFMTPLYLSSAQLRVVYETSPATVLPRETGRASIRERDQEALINIQTILTGPSFLDRVATEWRQRMGQDVADTLGRGRPGAALGRKLHIAQDGPLLFSIGVKDPDPGRAHALASLLLERFLQEERASRLQPSTSTRDFLIAQREVHRREVETAEARLMAYQQSMISASLVGNPINEGNLSYYETVLARLREEVGDAGSGEMASLERQARAALGRVPTVGDMAGRSAIAAAMRELTGLEYDGVLGLASFDGTGDRGERLGGLRLRLNQEVETEVGRRHPSLGMLERTQVAAYLYQRLYQQVRRDIVARLQRDLVEYRTFVARQPEQSAQIVRLRDEADRARQQLVEIERGLSQENMRIEANLSEIGYKMVVRDTPGLPLRPVEPDRMRLGFLGLLMALFIGGGLVVLAEMTDRSFRSVVQIEKELGVPVVGTLPVVEGPFFGRPRRRWRWAWLVAFLLVAAVGLLALGPRLG